MLKPLLLLLLFIENIDDKILGIDDVVGTVLGLVLGLGLGLVFVLIFPLLPFLLLLSLLTTIVLYNIYVSTKVYYSFNYIVGDIIYINQLFLYM